MVPALRDSTYAYIEFYVGMAKMVAYWHAKAMGFRLEAYRGPETGQHDVVSYVLRLGDVRIVITSAARPTCFDVLSFVDRHGNGVKRIAHRVQNVDTAYADAIAQGAIPSAPPARLTDEGGTVVQAALKLLDGKELLLVDDSHYDGPFMPGYVQTEIDGFEPTFESDLTTIDHIAYGMHINETHSWSRYLQGLFGGRFELKINNAVDAVDGPGLSLGVLRSDGGRFTNVFVEPRRTAVYSQVQEYLDAYGAAGVQHVALQTNDIWSAVRRMRAAGCDFVKYPDSYYDLIRDEYGLTDQLVSRLRTSQVLCDRHEDQFLFQTFTKPFGDRPTFFYEIIQRVHGYDGFALRNIDQLFRAVEQESGRRG